MDNGVITNVFTGMVSPHAMAFLKERERVTAGFGAGDTAPFRVYQASLFTVRLRSTRHSPYGSLVPGIFNEGSQSF